MIEEWRQIPDFPDYEVSSLGRVRKGDRYLSLASRIRGYVRVSLGHLRWCRMCASDGIGQNCTCGFEEWEERQGVLAANRVRGEGA